MNHKEATELGEGGMIYIIIHAMIKDKRIIVRHRRKTEIKKTTDEVENQES